MRLPSCTYGTRWQAKRDTALSFGTDQSQGAVAAVALPAQSKRDYSMDCGSKQSATPVSCRGQSQSAVVAVALPAQSKEEPERLEIVNPIASLVVEVSKPSSPPPALIFPSVQSERTLPFVR